MRFSQWEFIGPALCAAAIIKDGKLIAAAREERFSRIKFADGFPLRAIEFCLREAKLSSIKGVDKVVFAWNPKHEARNTKQ